MNQVQTLLAMAHTLKEYALQYEQLVYQIERYVLLLQKYCVVDDKVELLTALKEAKRELEKAMFILSMCGNRLIEQEKTR